MNKHVVLVNASTLQEAKCLLKTSLGILEQWYHHCEAFPIHGTGQGSGNSPHIWCFVCSVLVNAFEEAMDGATFVSHNGLVLLTIHMVGFVDNFAQRVNDFQANVQPTAADLCNRMRQDTSLEWSHVGIALKISRCSYHLIESTLQPNGKPFLKGGTQDESIVITNGLVASQVQQKSNYEAHKMSDITWIQQTLWRSKPLYWRRQAIPKPMCYCQMCCHPTTTPYSIKPCTWQKWPTCFHPPASTCWSATTLSTTLCKLS